MVKPVRVESDYDLFANHQSRSRAAAIFINQILDGGRVGVDVAFLESNSSSREVGRGGAARWSTGLGEDDDLGRGCQKSFPPRVFGLPAELRPYFSSTYSMS